MNELSKDKCYKHLRIANTLFAIGCFFVLIGSFSAASSFKFIPRWIESFVGFIAISFAFFIIAGFLTIKHDKSYIYAFITVGLTIVTSLVASICNTSTDPLYRAWSKGLEFSADLLLAIYYMYYFHASYTMLGKHGRTKAQKKLKISCTVFFGVYVTYFLAFLVGKMPVITHNIIANRVFSYGTWILLFVA